MHDAVKGFRVDMSELQLYDPMLHTLRFISSATAWSRLAQLPEWKLLNTWHQELSAHLRQDSEQIWHMCMHERKQFAHTLRELGWRVYHYSDAHGLEGITDATLHYNYGRRWGYIVAPYCEKFVVWRLSQL
jgi:hypothetical protein